MSNLVPLRISGPDVEDAVTLSLDDVEAAIVAGDYESLEMGRRDLAALIAQLKVLLDALTDGVVRTLPQQGAVIDGSNTVVKAGSVTRKYDGNALLRRLVHDLIGRDPTPGTDLAVLCEAIALVWNLDQPRMGPLDEYRIPRREYEASSHRGNPSIEVAK